MPKKQKAPDALLKLRIPRTLDRELRSEAKRKGMTRARLVKRILTDAVLQLELPFDASPGS